MKSLFCIGTFRSSQKHATFKCNLLKPCCGTACCTRVYPMLHHAISWKRVAKHAQLVVRQGEGGGGGGTLQIPTQGAGLRVES